MIVNSGGAAALVDYVRENKGNVRLPGIMALGFISAFSETLALAVIVARGATIAACCCTFLPRSARALRALSRASVVVGARDAVVAVLTLVGVRGVLFGAGIPALKDALINEPEDHVKAATVWTLGQIGRHTPDHAKAIAEGGVLQPMVLLHVRDDSSAGEPLRTSL